MDVLGAVEMKKVAVEIEMAWAVLEGEKLRREKPEGWMPGVLDVVMGVMKARHERMVDERQKRLRWEELRERGERISRMIGKRVKGGGLA